MAAERLRQFASAAAAAAVSIARPNYFDSGKRGEIYELRSELNGDLHLVRKEAVKKVIASMTLGKDVSSLFPDVLKNVQTDDMEMKKLVYLYLMNYATSQPELVVLAINSFCKDAEDSNPLVRALAIRTMGCIRVEKVLDYLCVPLEKALKDKDAYVRMTAVLCVPKVYSLSPSLAEENGFIETLREMLSDNTASVVANVVVALTDIQHQNPRQPILKVDSRIASRLISVLNDCTEWGQIALLDALAQYRPEAEGEVVQFIERITPRLQHVNSSVVMSAVKVILLYMDLLPEGHELLEALTKKLAPPLVSMLSTPPEVQYVVLRNLNLILQKQRNILAQGVRVFFCKFNDPLYVKLEKLDIITLLTDEKNYDQVLSELGEYAKEVEVEFVRKAILMIAKCAIKVPLSVGRVFNLLEQLLASSVGFITQAVAIALHELLRKYPENGRPLITPLLSNMDVFDEDESRAAIVWIIGEYETLLSDAVERLHSFASSFSVETRIVQSELITTAAKLFFTHPDTYRPFFEEILQKGIRGTENADLRERSILYARLLDMDANIIRSLAWENLRLQPPQVSSMMDPDRLNALMPYLSTIASVYHRLPPSPTTDQSQEAPSMHKPPPLPDLLNLDDEMPTLTLTSPPVLSPLSSQSSLPDQVVGGSSQLVDLLGD